MLPDAIIGVCAICSIVICCTINYSSSSPTIVPESRIVTVPKHILRQ